MIDIKDNTENTLHSTPINNGSKRKFQLMKDDYITLKFSLGHPVDFPLGTYVECDFGRFDVVENQSPSFNASSGGYDYELKLEADYMKWRNKLFKYQPEVLGGNEASFSLTAPLWQHLDIFLRCLKAWGYKHGGLEYQYFIDDTVTGENLFLTYSNTNLIDALTMMAEAAGCEWWVKGADIHFGRLANGNDPVTLEIGDNAVSMPRSKSSGEYFTRIFSFGGTSNISPRYRKKLGFMLKGMGNTNEFNLDKQLVPEYFRDNIRTRHEVRSELSYEGQIKVEAGGVYGSSFQFVLLDDASEDKLVQYSAYDIDLSGVSFIFQATSIPSKFKTLKVYVGYDTFSGIELESVDIDEATYKEFRIRDGRIQARSGRILMWIVSECGQSEVPMFSNVRVVGPAVFRSSGERVDTTCHFEGDEKEYNISLNYRYASEYGDDETFPTWNKWYLNGSRDDYDRFLSYQSGNVKLTIDGLVRTRVPIGYFDADVDGLTVNGVVQRRLMLPEGIPYVDLYEDMTDDEVIEGIVVFDYVYPGKVLTVSAVDDPPIWTDVMEEYTDESGETQERPTGIKVPTYTIRATDLAGFSQEYIIGDALTVTFQTGSLAGLSFGVSFLSDKSSDTEAVFQIVANENYGGRLPDTVMLPKEGDTFVMAGYDTEYLFNDLTSESEQRLHQETLKYKEKLLGNLGTVTATLFSDWSKEKCAADGSLHPLAAGDMVTIDNKALFPTPTTMRVIGYELNLDIPWDSPVYTIGESPAYSRLGALENKVDSVSLNGSSYMVGAVTQTNALMIKLVKTNDRTAASDTNAYSAARTDKEISKGVQEAKDYADEKVEGMDDRYLSKAHEDSTEFPLHLEGGVDFGKYIAGLTGGKIDATGAAELLSLILRTGLQSDNFSTGVLGAGFCLKKDENGDSYIEVDRILARKIATFVQLMIQELRHVGGQIVLTPASMKCSRVEEIRDNVLTDADGELLYDSNGELLADSTDGTTVQFYRCYFEVTDGERTIHNEFAVGDLSRCQTFNIKEGLNEGVSNTYYWRLVTGVGDGFIDLSATDCDAGSGIPAPGDEIVQLGNRTDETRQSAIILSAYGDDAPYIKMYRGINSYSLDGKEFFKASRTTVDIVADTIRFRTGQSVEDVMDVMSENLAGITDKVDEIVGNLSENISFVNALSEELELVKKQADGAIESFFGKYDPDLNNDPASGWTTEEDKARHAKDTFTNISTGHSWSWVKDGTEWKWVEIEDTATAKALADAAKAQDTADGKRRVFVNTPTNASEYDPGDLWVNATYGGYTNEMLRCNTKKAAGAVWSIGHWEKASKYTDDTAAEAAAEAAKEAKENAEAANADLSKFKADNIISPVEKTALKQQMADIEAEYAEVEANATRYSVSTTAYKTAYDKAVAALTKYTASSPMFITVESDYADISAYYAARQSVLDATAKALKDISDGAISNVDVEYALGDSPTTEPESGWQTESPQWTEGKYIWQRTVTTTASGKVVRSKAVCIQGAAGRGVSGTDVTYQAGTSGTTPPTGSWSASVPSVAEGGYLWTRTVITYNDGTKSTSYSVGKMGEQGKPGADGDGIASVSVTYQVGTSGTTPPTGSWSASVPSPQKGKYLWARTVTTYKKGSPTTTYSVSYYGTDGTAAKYVRVAGDQVFIYADNFSGNPTPASITLTATLVGTSGYQWSYRQAGQSSFTAISGATSQTYTLAHNNTTVWGSAKSVTLRCTSGGVSDEITVVKVSSGKNGSDAYTVILTNESHTFQGSTTASIAATTKCSVIAYKGAARTAATIGSITGMPTGMTVSLSGNGTTDAAFTVAVTSALTTGQGTLTVPVTVDGKQFTKSFSFSVAFKGDTGKGVKAIEEQYYLSGSSSSQTGGSWTGICPEWVKGKYIWTRSKVTWTDNTVTYSSPVLAGDINSLGERAEQAIENAANAKLAADNAQTDASEAKDRMDKWSADNVISPVEKQGVKDEMARVDADKKQIADGYEAYSLGTPTAYNTVYTSYRNALAVLSANSPETIAIPSDFASKQSAYYTNRSSCLNAIATAAKSYAEKVVAELEIGGMNLVAGTINGDGWTADSFDEEGGYFFKTSSSSGETYIYSPYIELETGRDVMLSFEARQDGGDKLKSSPDLYVLPDSYKEEGFVISGSGTGQYPVSTEWRRVSIKGHVPDTLKSKVRIRFDHNGTTDGSQVTIYVRRVKLEYGTVATDWSPAPEDLATKVDFQILEESVSSKVSKSDFDVLKGTVSTHKTQITQNANSITSQATSISGLTTRVSSVEQTTSNISLKVDAMWPDNLWIDGSFEEGLVSIRESNCAYTRTTIVQKFGSRSLRLDCKTGNSWVYIGTGQVPVKANTKYTLVFWIRATNTFTESGGSGIYESKDSELTLSKYTSFGLTLNSSWTRITRTFTTASSTNYIALRFGTSGQTTERTLYVDGIMLFEGDLSGDPPSTFFEGKYDKLLATGIDIENRKITVTADQFKIQNNDGETTASVNEDGLLQVGSGEFSGLIRQVPYIISEGTSSENGLTVGSDGYITLKKKNLISGGFIVITESANSYIGNGLNLPVGQDYAGCRIFIIKRYKELGITIRTLLEELPEGFDGWREKNDAESGALFRIRSNTAHSIAMGESTSTDNEFLELVAMPKYLSDTLSGVKRYGHVEWVVMNAWQWSVKNNPNNSSYRMGYRLNGY